jgi:leucyl-tRNA synthetase
MEYNFQGIEKKWQSFWADNKTNQVKEDSQKEKFYVLDMFPYPSGAGLHVGHPLGYIASDIYTRYKRLEGFNVLHPMGYDSFGLPAEQYAIQTGQHPAITTTQNIARYRDQLDKMGFAFDWSREVRTSSPSYYKWTQWIFKLLFESYYDTGVDKALPIDSLKDTFLKEGNKNVQAVADEIAIFSAQEWNDASSEDQEKILLNYRLAYLSDTWVNWCSALGTVLANDEVVNGTSIRGGHPVEQKKMRQWSLRIKAYADRLLQGLNTIDWTESIKEQQRNWIGKSIGASVFFSLELNETSKIEVFTTRPDTIFGVSFVVLAPEHPLVATLVSKEQSADVEAYIKASSLKTERDRQADIKNISGVFTGAYAIHPFSGAKIPVWIGDYVLASYGTGAVMAVPCGDQRDFNFAKFFNLPIPSIFKNMDCIEEAYEEKDALITNSSFLDDLPIKDAMQRAIAEIEKQGIGQGKINFRLRDAVFSRQRYWGEPFPVYYKNEIPYLVSTEHLPLTLPEVDKYLPTADGEPPLARSKPEDWNHFEGDRMEYNTMPGWAGSSWYFLRYLDPENKDQFVSKEKVDYWQNVDLYIGGAEHATGHLLYSRFWTKFLYDCNLIPFDEPFKKLINQGMILGRSSFVYRIQGTKQYVSYGKKDAYDVIPIHVDISLVDGDKLNVNGFKNWMAEYKDATFIFEDDGTYSCGFEVEKMSKSKFNVQTPDELVQKFGADTLRMYEMFLGPLEQSKPWDTKGITGVHGFLKKYWRLFYASGNFKVDDGQASAASLKSLHKTIKRLRDDLDRFSFNTGVSSFMICVNELSEQKCANRHILTQLTLLMAPYAPHITEEIWSQLSPNSASIFDGQYPKFDPQFLVEENIDYPVSFNGKMRLKINLAQSLTAAEIEALILELPEIQKWTEGATPKKIIVVHGKIINIVL